MASEINVSGSISYYKSAAMASAVGRNLAQAFNITGSAWIEGSMSVTTGAAAIPLGAVTSPHWAWFHNNDATNYIKLRNGAAGADLIRLYPGEGFPVALDPSAVPYAIAVGGTCLMDYLILQL